MKFINKLKEIVKERKFKYICFFWIIISIQFVIGSNLQNNGHSIRSFSELGVSLLKIVIFSIIFIVLHYLVLELLKKCKRKDNKKEKKFIINKHNFLIYFIIIILCWIPVLLAFYPVILNYDGNAQIKTYITNQMTHHTIISTMLMGMCYATGLIIENTQIGMLFFSIIQMTIMALIFAYAVKFIEEKTNKKWIRNVSLIFYALFPFNQLFPLMTTKDTLFAGFMLVFFINLYKIIENKNTIIGYIGIILLTVLMLLFRKNGIYAFVVMIPFAIVIFFKQKETLKRILVIFLITLLTYKCANTFLLSFDKNKGEGEVYDSIMISQAIGRICREKENELTDEEREKINYYVKDFEKMQEKYRKNISDPAVTQMNYKNINEDKKEFFKFVISLVSQYPGTSIDACLDTVRGYWYITDKSFNRIYKSEQKGCLELTFSRVFPDEEIGIKQHSLIPGLKEFYEDLLAKNYYEKIPVLYVVFQPAIYFYILLACLLYSLYKKQKNNLLPQIFLLLYYLTCFLAPCAIIRYMYGVIVAMPIVIGTTINQTIEGKDENGEDKGK